MNRLVIVLGLVALLGSGVEADREIACGPDRPYETEVSAKDAGLLANEGYINRTAGSYEPNSLCEWRITSTDGTPIEIIIVDMDIEFCSGCRCDGLRIWEGSEPGAPEDALYTLCGDEDDIPAEPIELETDQAYVQFYADDFVPIQGYRGFLARYGFPIVSTACTADRPDIIERATGVFATPEWPSDYPNNADCQWILRAPEGQSIRITYLSFDLENGCNQWDTVRIYDGSDEDAPMIGQWYGTPGTLPPTIMTRSNEAYIHFTSDSSVTYSGFVAVWEFVDNQ